MGLELGRPADHDDTAPNAITEAGDDPGADGADRPLPSDADNESDPDADPLRGDAGPSQSGTARADDLLLGDAAGLRDSWQRLQTGFVDDPRAAVSDAADLVEHAAQALAGALRQRQRGLREVWENTASGGADTEQLRLLMQRYRALFNQICRSGS